MEENHKHTHAERATISARFFNRVHRYKNLVLSRWWILVLGVALAAGAESYLLVNAPPSYKSEGAMVVGGKINVSGVNVYSDADQNILGTTLQMLQSETISNRAIGRLQEEKPGLRPVRVTLRATVSPRTEIFSLRATGTSPDFVQAYLQATMEEFNKLKKEMASNTTETAHKGLDEAIEKVSSDLLKSKEDLLEYGTQNPIVFQQDGGNSAANYLSDLHKQREQRKMDLDLLNVMTLDESANQHLTLVVSEASKPVLSETTSRGGSPDKPASPIKEGNSVDGGRDGANSGLIGAEGDYLKAKQQMAMLEAKTNDYAKVYRPKHPRMIALMEDFARQKQLLDIFRGQTAEQLDSRKHSLELEIKTLDANIAKWETLTLDTSKKMADYQSIKENKNRLQQIYDNLLNSQRVVEVDAKTSPDTVTIWQPATPATKVVPATFKYLSLAGLIGFAFGVCVLLTLDRLDDRPTSFTEMEDLFDETILGQIPQVPTKSKKSGAPILQPEDDRHAMVEAYRNLRSSIVFMASPEAHPKTIVLTSAIPGDGKSMTSANLAITIARAGSRILLIDADLRRGVMHKHFEVQNTIGFADVLAGQVPWTKALVTTSVPNLGLIPRGNVPRHPGELFMSDAKQKFLREVSDLYDFVLFDTPPVMAADDVSNLAPYVDGVVMVVRAGYTSGRVARAALDLLYMRKVTVLGLTFNGVQSHASEYYYYKYKEYYAKYPAAS